MDSPSSTKKADYIINILRQRHPQDDKLRIIRSIPNFWGGELVIIEVSNGDKVIGENYVYSRSDAGFFSKPIAFLSMDELMNWIDQARPIRASTKTMSMSAREIVPAILATIFTVSIIGILIAQAINKIPFDVPDILSNALTIIIGFYFGQQVPTTSQKGITPTKTEE